MITVINRKVTPSEAQRLVAAIQLTPSIIGYSVQEWVDSEHVIVAEDPEGLLVGACLNYDFHSDWRKLAALIVMGDFRGKGIGRTLFHKSCSDTQKNNRNIYTISSNQIVIQMMDDLGFSTFKNILYLSQAHRAYGALFCLHSLRWMMHFYRLREIFRKTILYREKTNFVFGTKVFDHKPSPF